MCHLLGLCRPYRIGSLLWLSYWYPPTRLQTSSHASIHKALHSMTSFCMTPGCLEPTVLSASKYLSTSHSLPSFVTFQCVLATGNRGTMLGPFMETPLPNIHFWIKPMQWCHVEQGAITNPGVPSTAYSPQCRCSLTAPNLFRCLAPPNPCSTLRTWRPRNTYLALLFFSAPLFLQYQKDFLITFPSKNNSPYVITSLLPITWASFYRWISFPFHGIKSLMIVEG